MKLNVLLTGLFVSATGIGSYAQQLREIKIYNGDEVVFKDFTHTIDEIGITDRENYPEVREEWQLSEVAFGLVDNPKVYCFKDKLYDGLFTRNLGWNGGDGGQTTLLPGGHIYWTYADSFWGVVNPETRARGESTFPRNTVVIQEADADGMPVETQESFHWLNSIVNTTDPNAPKYYCGRTFIRHPEAKFSDEEIERGEIDSDFLYWAGDGTVVNGQLQMLWNAVNSKMEPQNTCLAIYSLEGKPGDETYMKVISEDHNFRPKGRIFSYGNTMWEDPDGHVYLYGSHNSGFLDNRPVVARSVSYDLRDTWEYYIKDENGNWTWQTEEPTKEQLDRSQIADRTLSFPWVFEEDGQYYLISQTFPFGEEFVILRGEHPWGPFTDSRELMKFPKELDKLGDRKYQDTYMVEFHPALSREGEIVISTCTEADNFWKNFNDVGSADYYRPYFYRIYNWKAVYDK